MEAEVSSNEVKRELEFRKQTATLKLTLRLYSLVGAVVSTVAAAYFALSFFPYQLTPSQQISVLIAGVGGLVALLAKIVSSLLEEKEGEHALRQQYANQKMQFVEAWIQFEAATRDLYKSHGVDLDNASVRLLFVRLIEDEVISPDEVLILEEALRARNAIVHGGMPPSLSALDPWLRFMAEVTGRVVVALGEGKLEKPTSPSSNEGTSDGVSVDEPWELAEWTRSLGVTEEELRAAIRLVGPSSAAVRGYLRQNK